MSNPDVLQAKFKRMEVLLTKFKPNCPRSLEGHHLKAIIISHPLHFLEYLPQDRCVLSPDLVVDVRSSGILLYASIPKYAFKLS